MKTRKIGTNVLTVSLAVISSKLPVRIMQAKITSYEYSDGKLTPILKQSGREVNGSTVHIFDTVEQAVEFLKSNNHEKK